MGRFAEVIWKNYLRHLSAPWLWPVARSGDLLWHKYQIVTNNTDILSESKTWLSPSNLAKMSASVRWQMAWVWQHTSRHRLSSITEIFFKRKHRTQNTQLSQFRVRRWKVKKREARGRDKDRGPELQKSGSHFILRFSFVNILTLHNSIVCLAHLFMEIDASWVVGEEFVRQWESPNLTIKG